MRSGVNGTPTFFVNGVRHDGPWDEASLLESLRGTAASPAGGDRAAQRGGRTRGSLHRRPPARAPFIEPVQDALVTLLAVALLGLMAHGLLQALSPGSGLDDVVLRTYPDGVGEIA